MIEYLSQNDIQYVIVFDIDRFSRAGSKEYQILKEEILWLGVKLIDTKWVIWESRIIHTNDTFDLWKYEWNYENPNSLSELVLSENAAKERRTILQRTIPIEVKLEQEGYHMRQSNYWYKNKQIRTHLSMKWKACILVEHHFEWRYVKEIYQLRTECKYSDKQIVDILNANGCKKRSWEPMDVKYMQQLIIKPVYAWIIASKWTEWKAIKTKSDALVDIDTWNAANKWKIKILHIDGDYFIEHQNKWSEIKEYKIPRRRWVFSKDAPYSHVIKCPVCWSKVTKSNSTSRNGTIHHYYQCKGNKKNHTEHKNYTSKRDQVHQDIEKFFQQLHIPKEVYTMFDSVAKKVFEQKETTWNLIQKNKKSQIKKIDKDIKELEANMIHALKHESVLDSLNNQLTHLKNQKLSIVSKTETSQYDINKAEFIHYAKKLLPHIKEFAIDRENPEIMKLWFYLIFWWRISHEEIVNHTQQNSDFWSIISQQKNPSEEEFSSNHLWHPH